MSHYWLLKTEPGCFSIHDLEKLPGKTSPWDGVRNYQARNFMRDDMRPGDLAFFYHSVTDPGIVGLVEIAGPARPDPTQWDMENEHFDPASPADKPRWYLVDVRLKEVFKNPLPLAFLRAQPDLAGMELLRKGSRLSIQPVSPEHFETVMSLTRTGMPKGGK